MNAHYDYKSYNGQIKLNFLWQLAPVSQPHIINIHRDRVVVVCENNLQLYQRGCHLRASYRARIASMLRMGDDA